MRRALIPLLVTLLTVELCARVATRYPPVAMRLGYGTPTSRRLVAQAMARDADDPMRRQAEGRIAFHPRWGWMNRPGEVVDQYTSHVDARGRRVTGPQGDVDGPIVLLGDSFTFGDEVDDEASFAWQLRERAGTGVVNLGTLGYGLDQMLLTLRDGDDLRPTVVVVGVNALTVTRNPLLWDAWLRPRFGLVDGRLVEPVLPLPAPEVAARPSLFATSDIVALWREVLDNPMNDDARKTAYADALLAALKAEIEARGAVPLFVWQPLPEDVRPTGFGSSHEREIVLRSPAVRDHLLDLAGALSPLAAAGVPIQQQVHWTPQANAAIADAVAAGLAERHLLTGR